MRIRACEGEFLIETTWQVVFARALCTTLRGSAERLAAKPMPAGLTGPFLLRAESPYEWIRYDLGGISPITAAAALRTS